MQPRRALLGKTRISTTTCLLDELPVTPLVTGRWTHKLTARSGCSQSASRKLIASASTSVEFARFASIWISCIVWSSAVSANRYLTIRKIFAKCRPGGGVKVGQCDCSYFAKTFHTDISIKRSKRKWRKTTEAAATGGLMFCCCFSFLYYIFLLYIFNDSCQISYRVIPKSARLIFAKFSGLAVDDQSEISL